jgi:hypothetical protein
MLYTEAQVAKLKKRIKELEAGKPPVKTPVPTARQAYVPPAAPAGQVFIDPGKPSV